jgi:hypothetical protein
MRGTPGTWPTGEKAGRRAATKRWWKACTGGWGSAGAARSNRWLNWLVAQRGEATSDTERRGRERLGARRAWAWSSPAGNGGVDGGPAGEEVQMDGGGRDIC